MTRTRSTPNLRRVRLSQPGFWVKLGGTRSRVLNRSGGEPEVGQTIDSCRLSRLPQAPLPNPA